MKRVVVLSNIAIAAGFIVYTAYHFFYPGDAYVFTRVLIANWLLVIPMLFLAMLAPAPLTYLRSKGRSLRVAAILMACVLVVAAIAVGNIAQVFGLHEWMWFVVFLFPVVSHAVITNTSFAKKSLSAVVPFLGSIMLGFMAWGIVSLLGISLDTQLLHMGMLDIPTSDDELVMIIVTIFTILVHVGELSVAYKLLQQPQQI